MNKKTLALTLAFLAILALLAGIYMTTRPEIEVGPKSFTLTIVHKDGSEKVLELTSEAEFLGPALTELGIIIPSDSPGMYNTVDGETADYSEDQSYWSFLIAGEYAMEGMDTTPITEGGTYSLVYTVYEAE